MLGKVDSVRHLVELADYMFSVIESSMKIGAACDQVLNMRE